MKEMVEFNHVSKSFKNKNVLNDVTLSFEEGRIYGLIGQNGAGKTTLMRIIAGLTLPTRGSLSLLGNKVPKYIEKARKEVGFLIENPALYPGLTAEQNMKIQQLLKGYDSKEERVRLLQLVNLETNNKKTHDFSMGMKQRLGIAMALVGHPRLLVLDEPINGLDPEGIVKVRNLLRDLQSNGTTIILSSHILPELMNVVSDFVLMDSGHIIEQEGREELECKLEKKIIIKTSDNKRALIVMEELYPELDYKSMENRLVFVKKHDMDINKIGTELNRKGISIMEFGEKNMQLDEYFLGKLGK
ncbi:MAG: ABC transporter ATP-binding protein [Oribacterium sp.]|nr:ABC transporter ATP-binding protein [Oribacterium sp.]